MVRSFTLTRRLSSRVAKRAREFLRILFGRIFLACVSAKKLDLLWGWLFRDLLKEIHEILPLSQPRYASTLCEHLSDYIVPKSSGGIAEHVLNALLYVTSSDLGWSLSDGSSDTLDRGTTNRRASHSSGLSGLFDHAETWDKLGIDESHQVSTKDALYVVAHCWVGQFR